MNDKHHEVVWQWPLTGLLGFLLGPMTALTIILIGFKTLPILPLWVFVPFMLGTGIISYYAWVVSLAAVLGLGMVVTGNWPKFWGIMKGD